MKKILLVEDTREVQILVQGILKPSYDVVVVDTVAAAEHEVRNSSYDLIIADIGLPDGDGLEFCAKIKTNDSTSQIPLILLTMKGGLTDKISGFSMGADDYVVKPFEPLELRARVDVKLKTSMRSSSGVLVKGFLKINVPFQKVFLVAGEDEIDLSLRPNEFRLIYYFVHHEGHVLSRRHLIEKVWGDRANVTERTIDTHVYCLRKKLKSHAGCLESVFGEGYRFTSRPGPSPGI